MRHNRLNRVVITLLAAWLGSFTSQAQLVTGLTAVDVGTPPFPGSTTANAPGSFAVAGAGEYKNSASDNFHFAYTNVTGDFDYQVRIESLEVQSQWSKAGLMARETTDATVAADIGSRSITMTSYPPPPDGGNTLILIRREQTDTPTADDILGTTPVYPNNWLRLRRLRNTMIGYTGTNGVNWDLQGARDSDSWPEGPLRSDLLLGLAVSSASSAGNVTAQFREFGRVPSTQPVAISIPLRSVTVNKGKTATFSVTVTGYDPYYAQWYTNGTAITGGTNFSFGNTLTYTTAALNLTDDNTIFSVIVSNSVNSVTNGNAVLHVLDDNVPPAVTAATVDSSGIDVLFSEEVSSATATRITNYTLQGEGLDVIDVVLSSNNRIASLTLSGPVTVTNATLRVARVEDLVGNLGTNTVPLLPLLQPLNIVASGYASDRELAFTSATDGFLDGGWQTTGDRDRRPQFAGLIYNEAQTFRVLKVDLGEQTLFGGSFAGQPKVYLLKNNVDTDITGPEMDPTNWEQVGAQLISPNLFDANIDPNPSPASPIVFDLSGLSASLRAGYGWAVGGVPGDDSGFIRLSELRAYGQSGGVVESAPTLNVATSSANSIVISWPAAATDFVLKSTPSLTSPNWSPVNDPKVVVGNNFTVTVMSSSGTRFYRLEK